MTHTPDHKLDVACLDCIRVHLEHKNKLKYYVTKMAVLAEDNDIDTIIDLARDAHDLLKEIENE